MNLLNDAKAEHMVGPDGIANKWFEQHSFAVDNSQRSIPSEQIKITRPITCRKNDFHASGVGGELVIYGSSSARL